MYVATYIYIITLSLPQRLFKHVIIILFVIIISSSLDDLLFHGVFHWFVVWINIKISSAW